MTHRRADGAPVGLQRLELLVAERVDGIRGLSYDKHGGSELPSAQRRLPLIVLEASPLLLPGVIDAIELLDDAGRLGALPASVRVRAHLR